MRRFLGLTKPPSSQSEIDKTAPKKEPIIRSDSTKSETKKRATKSIERIKTPLPEKDIVGLGLNLAAEVPGTTSRAPSRHVAFVPTPLATPTLSALSPDLTASPFPVLTTQPSFESRHGLQLNCFPRSTPSATTPSNSTASNSSDQLQRPSAPLAHIPVQSFTNNSNRLSTHNPQVPPNRTSSSLSNKSNIIGRSPYGLNSFPSTSRLPLEGQDQVIQSAMTWSDLVSPDLVINLGERERTRQEVLYEVVASEER